MLSLAWAERLESARAGAKRQALIYRALAAAAEDAGDAALAERLNELHADEQHHLSRLTARLIELGGTPADLAGMQVPRTSLDGWEESARARERDEVARHEALLDASPDDETAAVLRDILAVERLHEQRLGGKWTPAARDED